MSDSLKIKSLFREYEVYFCNDFVEELKKCLNENAYVLIDERVLNLYHQDISPLLPEDRTIVLKAVEENKNFSRIIDYTRDLIGKKIRKNSTLVAVGGGIIQDITAFMASILFRGVEWTFFPTTLLAQADSCIGSKNSINVDSYKNLVGNFYPPSKIISASRFLETLSVSEIKSGIGEMLHFYYFRGRQEADDLASQYDSLLTDRNKLARFIRLSLDIKRSIAEQDEFDRGIRNLFNYGHTFGHAIEAVSNFAVPHGQAVTLGMDLANTISLKLGWLAKEDFDAMHRVLRLNKPNYKVSNDRMEEYFQALSKDKKNAGNKLGCILCRGPGKLEKVMLDMDEKLKSIIRDYFESK